MKSTRRSFIKAAAAGAGAIALTPVIASAADHTPQFGENEVGMLYDSTLCVGCKACVTSCRNANYFMDDSSKIDPKDEVDTRWANVDQLDYRTKNIIKMYENPEDKKEFAFIKRQCMHCNAPGCVSACPVKAMTKNKETGIVEYNKHACIGCRYCQMACPFNVPAFEWHRAIPKITKCEMCRDTNLKTKNIPACCEVCPTKAVIYGKRNDLMADAKQRLEAKPDMYQPKIYGEHDYGGTNVIYVSKVDFEKLGMPKLGNTSAATFSESIQHTIYKWGIAPVALYAAIVAIALTHRKKRESGEKKNDKGGRA